MTPHFYSDPDPAAGCPSCDGTGQVDIDRADSRGEHTTETIECPDCYERAEARDFADGDPEERGADCEAECAWESPL